MKNKPFLPSPRRRAREYAVQSLYQIQINPDILPEQAAKSVYDSIAKDKAAARSALESRDWPNSTISKAPPPSCMPPSFSAPMRAKAS